LRVAEEFRGPSRPILGWSSSMREQSIAPLNNVARRFLLAGKYSSGPLALQEFSDRIDDHLVGEFDSVKRERGSAPSDGATTEPSISCRGTSECANGAARRRPVRNQTETEMEA